MKKIRLATRGSPLAMAQAKMAMDFLSTRLEAEFEIVEIKTMGDKNQNLSLSVDGGSGLFTKEIEFALEHNVKLIGELVPYHHGWERYDSDNFMEIVDRINGTGLIINLHFRYLF